METETVGKDFFRMFPTDDSIKIINADYKICAAIEKFMHVSGPHKSLNVAETCGVEIIVTCVLRHYNKFGY